MSAPEPNAAAIAGGVSSDIWQQHESQIRDLYQNKKRTLKQVKEEMEKRGFPKKPLSTWESKLRVDLKIRKKNKAADWPLVYRHLAARLEELGKKQLKCPATIRLDGKEIPFDEAWKEIRRSGAHKLSPHLLPQGGLPCGIEVRTSSPVLSQPLITEQSNTPVPPAVLSDSRASASLQLYAPQTEVGVDPQTVISTTSILISNTGKTPWVSLCGNLRLLFQHGVSAPVLDAWNTLGWWKIVPVGRTLRAQDIEGVQSRMILLPIGPPRFPRPSPDLGYRLVSSWDGISLTDFLSTSIYLLSNKLHDQYDGDKGLQVLFLLLQHDIQLFIRILQSEPFTGKAAWESLFEYARRHRLKRIFSFLLRIGIRFEWFDPSDAGALVSALELDCPTDVVAEIIHYLCRFSRDYWWRDILNAISLACGKHLLHIANMLVQRFDINVDMINSIYFPGNPDFPPLSIFLGFVVDFDSNDDGDWHVLEFLLLNGADVDKLLPASWYIRESIISRGWHDDSVINRGLRPTVLDISYRLDRSLYKRLAQNSRVTKSTLTKAGILTSLEEGPNTLREYLKTRVPTNHVLNWQMMRSTFEYLMMDQLRPTHRKIWLHKRNYRHISLAFNIVEMDVNIVHSLIQYGVNWDRDSKFLPDIHEVLSEVLRQLRKRVTDDALQLFDLLLHKGAVIREKDIEDAVQKSGIGFLEWLQPRVKSFSVKSIGALAQAARLNNFEAVEFLLRSGVDPNGFIGAETTKLSLGRKISVRGTTCAVLGQAYSVQAIAAGLGREPDFKFATLRMSQILNERGANDVVCPSDSTPFAFVMVLLEHGYGDPELLDKTKFVLGTLKRSKKWTNPPAFLLELCFEFSQPKEFKERIKIFEHLLNEGAQVIPGSPLAALVRAGGPKELVERVLRSGAKLNAYTSVYCPTIPMERTWTPLQAAADRGNEDLVRLFLERGANVNSPARGSLGATALQAICGWGPATEKEHRRKITICEVLLSHGAEVNAAPEKLHGRTALQAAAARGDIELTAILLRHGAHVNAPPSKFNEHCALDWAALAGRLDVVKLLLESHALSYHRGSNGYDGAIDIAQRWGHRAVASLIRDHVENGIVPRLHMPAEDYHIYEYDTHDEYPGDDDLGSNSDVSSSTEDEDLPEGDATQCNVSNEVDMTVLPASNDPGHLNAFLDLQVEGNILGDLMSHSATGFDTTGASLPMEWDL